MTQAANLAALGTNAGTTGILPIAGGGTAGTGGAIAFKNRIINGNMVINQRGFSGNVATDGQYTLDRWNLRTDLANKLAISQSSTAPVGFNYSLQVTTAAAVASPGYYMLCQYLEGFNTADLGWGTANAKTVTLSFWVYSSLTGTFGGSITNGAENYSYPFSYTISTANTWTQASITITGPTAGTWIGATNGKGMNLYFGLGVSSGLSGAAGSWSANGYYSSTGAVSVVSTASATWYVTGVQLEVGTAATNYDFRSYGTELGLCQRYYGVIVNQALIGGSVEYCIANFYSATELDAVIYFPTTMRVAPSLVQTSGTNYHYTDKPAPLLQFSSWGGIARAGLNSALLYLSSGVSGFTAGYGSMVYTNNNAAVVAVSAEL
jgi:hypothetical protein